MLELTHPEHRLHMTKHGTHPAQVAVVTPFRHLHQACTLFTLDIAVLDMAVYQHKLCWSMGRQMSGPSNRGQASKAGLRKGHPGKAVEQHALRYLGWPSRGSAAAPRGAAMPLLPAVYALRPSRPRQLEHCRGSGRDGLVLTPALFVSCLCSVVATS